MEEDEWLKKLHKGVAEKHSLEAKQRELHSQRERLQDRVQELEKIMEKEQLDVERMERTSLSSVFYAVLGKKEKVLDREKAEAYAAKLKYDSAVQQLQQVEEDLARVDTQLREIADCQRQYEQLLKEKTAAVKASGSLEAQHLFQIEREIIGQENQRREIQEAMLAGYRALNAAHDVLSSLDSAKNWGTFDLLGGGFVTDLVKHNRLGEAQYKVEQLQEELRHFKTELVDVRVDADMKVNVEGFLRFADYFFDGLFVDWAVLDKIKQSQAEVQNTIGQIEDVLEGLRGMGAATDERLSQLAEEKNVVVKANL